MPPVPPFLLTPDDNKKAKPIKIGSPEETLYQATVKLPAGSAPSLPVAVNLHESFADYQATYSFADGTLHAERRLTTKVSEIPIAQMDAYRAFNKAIANMARHTIPWKRLARTLVPLSIMTPTTRRRRRKYGFIKEQVNAAQRRPCLRRSIAAQPWMPIQTFPTEWFLLGSTQIVMRKEGRGRLSQPSHWYSDPSRYESVMLRSS